MINIRNQGGAKIWAMWQLWQILISISDPIKRCTLSMHPLIANMNPLSGSKLLATGPLQPYFCISILLMSQTPTSSKESLTCQSVCPLWWLPSTSSSSCDQASLSAASASTYLYSYKCMAESKSMQQVSMWKICLIQLFLSMKGSKTDCLPMDEIMSLQISV